MPREGHVPSSPRPLVGQEGGSVGSVLSSVELYLFFIVAVVTFSVSLASKSSNITLCIEWWLNYWRGFSMFMLHLQLQTFLVLLCHRGFFCASDPQPTADSCFLLLGACQPGGGDRGFLCGPRSVFVIYRLCIPISLGAFERAFLCGKYVQNN